MIEVAIQKSLAYENEIEAGDKRIREIRRYLDETENIPRLANSQIGSPDTVQSYPSFDAWIDSFAGSDEQIEEDQVLMERYKVARIGNQPETQRHTSSSAVSKMMVHLIVTDLTKEADSAQHVEQMFFPLDTEIREILGELKRKGKLKSITCHLPFHKVTSFKLRRDRVLERYRLADSGSLRISSAWPSDPVISGHASYDHQRSILLQPYKRTCNQSRREFLDLLQQSRKAFESRPRSARHQLSLRWRKDP